jgi:integrase
MAVAWAARLENDIECGRAGIVPPSLTVRHLSSRYLKEMATVRPFGRTKLATLKMIEQRLGAERVRNLTPARLVHYILHDRNISGVTASIELSVLGSLFKAARVMWNYPIPSDVINDAREMLRHAGMNLKSMERDRRPTSGEIEQLRGWLNDHSRSIRADHVDFILDSAFRPPSEVCRLRWADLNETDRTILIRDRKHPRKKYGNHQVAPLLGRCMDIIKRQPRSGEFIFPVNGKSWSSIFPRACRELGIEDLTLYDLRHEAISRLIESRQFTIPEVMLISGHLDPKMLMRYTQLKAKDLHR